MIKALGGLSLGQVVPIAATAGAQVTTAVSASLPALQAQLTGALQAQAQFSATPPSITGNLQVAQEIVAGIQTAIAVGAPSLDFQAAALGKVIAEIQGQVASLSASVAFAAELSALLGTGGVQAYAYTGIVATFGSEFSVELSGGLPGGLPGDPCNALVFATSSPTVWAAMGKVFAT